MNGTPEQKISFAEFQLDAAGRRLFREGEPVALKSKAFDVLLFLAENIGRVVSKDEILEAVWNEQFVEEANLTVQISALRKALGETKDAPRFLVTVPGKGYKFIADLHGQADEESKIIIESHKISHVVVETEEREELPQASVLLPVNQSKRRKIQFALTGTVLVILVALGIASYVWRTGEQRAAFANQPFQKISIKRLTTHGKVGNVSALSPDGKLFTYCRSEGEQQSLWLGHTDGGEQVMLRPPLSVRYYGLRFTPDGSSLFYTLTDDKGITALYKLPVFGGTPEKISEKVRNSIAFAPDGKRFAFVRYDQTTDKSSLIVTNLVNLEDREIAVPPSKTGFVLHSPAWSPDGLNIAVGAASNDAGSSYEIYLVNVADGFIQPLTANGWVRVDGMAWLSDGSGLIVTAIGADSARHQLWHVSYPGGEARQIVTDLGIYDYAINLSSDKDSLLAVQTQNQSNIWIAPADDLSLAKQITFGSIGRQDGWSGVEWMPDGRIIYTAKDGEMNSIWVMDIDGKQQKQLIPSGGNNVYPSFIAEKSSVVFQSTRSGKYAVWRANIDGGDLRLLTDDEIAAQPHVSPDGKWIVYTTNREGVGTLYRISTDGDEKLRLTDKPAGWARVSPDSKLVACQYNDNGKSKLAILPIEGGAPLKLFDVPRLANFRNGVRWRANGKAVTYRDWANGIWQQNLEGGKPERIVGLPEEKIYAYSWSPDGKWLAFTRGTEMRDVVLVSNNK